MLFCCVRVRKENPRLLEILYLGKKSCTKLGFSFSDRPQCSGRVKLEKDKLLCRARARAKESRSRKSTKNLVSEGKNIISICVVELWLKFLLEISIIFSFLSARAIDLLSAFLQIDRADLKAPNFLIRSGFFFFSEEIFLRRQIGPMIKI